MPNLHINNLIFLQHSDEKPFSCEQCDKSFKLKRALTVHIAQHSRTKTYKCTFCDRVFNSSTNFYTHRKNLHPQELQAMKEREAEQQRQKRIRAGIEESNQLKIEHEVELDDSYNMQNETITQSTNLVTLIPVNNDNNGIELIRLKNESTKQHFIITTINNASSTIQQSSNIQIINAPENTIDDNDEPSEEIDANSELLTKLIAEEYSNIESCEENDQEMIVNIQIGDSS